MGQARCFVCNKPLSRQEQGQTICGTCATEGTDAEGRFDGLAMSTDTAAAQGPTLPPLPPPIERKKLEFPCPSCTRTLRVATVRKRTRVQCPRCAAAFDLNPDGRVERLDAGLDSAADPPSDTRLPGNLFESGDFDGSGTGIDFERVSGLEGTGIEELRAAAGVREQKDEGFVILEDSGEAASARPAGKPPKPPKPPASKPSDRKPPAPQVGYVILAESGDEFPPPREAKSRGKKTTRRRALEQPKPGKAAPSSEAPGRGESSSERRGSGSALDSREFERSPRRGLGAAILVFIAPLLVASAFFASTTRSAGFAATGDLGAGLKDLGLTIERAVVRLNRDSLQLEAIEARAPK